MKHLGFIAALVVIALLTAAPPGLATTSARSLVEC
jgi:hypothetical protein